MAEDTGETRFRGLLSRSSGVLVAMAVFGFAVTLVTAGRPWYSFGSDSFTDTVNGWNTCVSAAPQSFEIWFMITLAIEVVGALVARLTRRLRVVGAAVAVLVGAWGVLRAFLQLSGRTIGPMCNGYDFDVLRGARISSITMIAVQVTVGLIACLAALRSSGRSVRA